MKDKLKDRYNILAIAFILMGAIITAQLVNLQIIHGELYDEESQRRLLNESKIVASRGEIFDTNGIPIAINRTGYIIQIVNADLKDQELNEMLLKLVKIFEKNNDDYYKDFSKFITFNPIEFGSAVKSLENPIARIVSEIGLNEKDASELKTARDVFQYLRKKKFKIDDKYTDEEAYKIMTLRHKIIGFSMLNPVALARDVSEETMAEIEERYREFPGVTTSIEPFRKYIDADVISHVIGYVGAINAEEYEANKEKGYGMNDLIGKTGVERAAEKWLRGKDGERRVEVDTEGRFTQELDGEPAVPGNNVILTIDMNLQKVAAESLERTITDIRERRNGKTSPKNLGDAFAGAVVAMDVNSGEVLAMASYPGYDPSYYIESAKNKEAQQKIYQWNNDAENRPLFNRAISATYPPGSTFKPVVGIAGIEEGYITPETKINDVGVKIVEGVQLKCLEYNLSTRWGNHGPIDLEHALATSCNMYFYELGMQMGIEKIDKWVKYFGLGEYTGIDLGGEAKGTRSNKEFHYKNFDYQWGSVLTAFSSIGQLYNSYTPLQLANYTSAIANGGKRYTPYVIKKVVSADGKVVMERKPEYEQIPVKKETLDAIKQGMLAVANSTEGTADIVFRDFPYKVAGKTGTAEYDPNHSNNGVFICFAPAEKPEIAVAVVIERGVFGYYAAEVARDIMTEYFKLNDKDNTGDTLTQDEVVFTR